MIQALLNQGHPLQCYCQVLEAQRRDTLAALEAAATARVATRRPLQRRGAATSALARAPAAKMYNPRFEEDFAAGRDYDPDRRAGHTCSCVLVLQCL